MDGDPSDEPRVNGAARLQVKRPERLPTTGLVAVAGSAQIPWTSAGIGI